MYNQAQGPQDLKVTSTPKVYSLVLSFLWRDLEAHTHLAYLHLCAYSSHVTLHSSTLIVISCYVFMCLVIRFPNMFGNIRACTIICLVLHEDRPRRMPLASLLVSPHFGEMAVTIGGHDRRSKLPIIPDWFNLSSLILWLNRRLRNRRMKPPLLPCFSRDQFGGSDRRPGHWMKPSIVRFQG